MSIISDKTILTSKNNRYNNTLTSGETYTGIPEINYHQQIMVNTLCSGTATLYIDVSPDNSNWNSYQYTITANEFDNQIITCGIMYVRIRLVNTAGSTIDVVLNTYFGSFGTNHLTHLNSSVASNQQTTTTKAVIYTQHLNGEYLPLQSYYNRAVNTSIINPISSFGEVLATSLYPFTQLQFSYYEGNITSNNIFNIFKNNSSLSKVRSSNIILSSGPNNGDYSILESKKFIKYNSGQGIRLRGTVLFSPIREGYQQAIGFGNKANGFFLYNSGTSISCLKRTNGAFETYRLSLTGTTATSNGLITLVLNSRPNYVSVTLNQTLIQIINNIKNNPLISWFDLGWEIFLEGKNLYFKSINPGNLTGTYSFTSTATGITDSFTKIVNGADLSEYIVNQVNWDDKCDGTTFIPQIDFTLGNVLELNFQWLGYGKVVFSIENPNNGLFQTFNTIKYANTSGRPTIDNPNGYIIAGSQNTTPDKTVSFTTGDINIIDNTITVSHTFSTGELVCYDNSSTNGVVPLTYTKTFNGSSSTVVLIAGQKSFIIPQHRLKNTEQVVYSNGGGTSITGLTNNTIYYVIYRDDDTIQLATSIANVLTYTSVSITGVGTGTNHSFSSWRYYIHSVDSNTIQLKTHFNDTSAITLSATGTRLLKIYNGYVANVDGSAITDNSTTITLVEHGLQNLETVRYINYSGGTPITGLTGDDIYYVSVVDDDNFSLTLYKGATPITLRPGTGDEHFFVTLSTFSSASISVFNEGIIRPNKLQSYSLNGRTTTISVDNTDIPMLAIFVKKEYYSKINSIPIIIKSLSFSYSKVNVNDKEITAEFNIYLNPLFSVYNPANTFTNVQSNVSVCSYSLLSSTDRITGGANIYTSYTQLGGITKEIDDIELQPGDLIVITGRRLAATDIILDSNITWYENL